MIVLDLVKTTLRLRAVTLLPKSSYIKISLCGDIVLRRVSYFVIKVVVFVVSVTI